MALPFCLPRLPSFLLSLADRICPVRCAARLRNSFTPALVPADPEVTRGWFLADVRIGTAQGITAPGITVGDVVWSAGAEGEPGTQAARMLELCARSGAASLRGKRGIRIEIVVHRLHVQSGERARKRSLPHDLRITLRAVDAVTGEVLLAETMLEARLPMVAGGVVAAETAAVQTHVARSIGGWLGTCAPMATSTVAPAAPAAVGLLSGLPATLQGIAPNAA